MFWKKKRNEIALFFLNTHNVSPEMVYYNKKGEEKNGIPRMYKIKLLQCGEIVTTTRHVIMLYI